MVSESILAKLIGISSGTALALIFSPPKTIKALARRTLAALITGYALGTQVRIFLHFNNDFDGKVAGFAIAAFCSWSLMTYARKLIAKLMTEAAKTEAGQSDEA